MFSSWCCPRSVGRAAVGRLVIRCEILHVLLGQAASDGRHAGVPAVPVLVGSERRHDIIRVLSTQLGYAVHGGIGGAPAGNTMATGTHRGFELSGLGVA